MIAENLLGMSNWTEDLYAYENILGPGGVLYTCI